MGEPGALLGFEIVLDINEQVDPSVALLRPPGWPGAPGDPGGDGFLRVVHAQGFHPGKPFLAGSAAGNIFPPLDFITLPLQAEQQIFKVSGTGDQPVNGFFQRRLIAGPGLGCLVFNIAFALILSRDDD